MDKHPPTIDPRKLTVTWLKAKARMNAEPCRECGHGRAWHVPNPDADRECKAEGCECDYWQPRENTED